MKLIIFRSKSFNGDTDYQRLYQGIAEIIPDAVEYNGSNDGDEFKIVVSVPKKCKIDAEAEEKLTEVFGCDYTYEYSKSEIGKKLPKVSFTSFIIGMVVVGVAAAILTLIVSMQYYTKAIIAINNSNVNREIETVVDPDTGEVKENIDIASTLADELKILDNIYESRYYDYAKIDKEALIAEVLKAYVTATGDPYSEYYTADEFVELLKDDAGDSEGIGISVVYTTVTLNDNEYQAFQVNAVYKNSPAILNDPALMPGDYIVGVGKGDDSVSVGSLGYTKALAALRGKAGTQADFTVVRFNKNNTDYDIIEFSITRQAYTKESVDCAVLESDNSIGIVHLMEFDLNAPKQFKDCVEELKDKGCTKFVIDLRNNPGGNLKSVEGILSLFLDEGDLIVSTEDKYGNKSEDFVKVYRGTGDYLNCSVTKEEIGMYKNMNFVVITNGNSASASELFTQTVRDYGLAKIVGEQTYGKGCMQNYFSLEPYGMPGGLRLTVAMYFSKSHTVYHGIGIVPDYTVELSEEAAEYNIYVLPQSLDNQLTEAIKHLK